MENLLDGIEHLVEPDPQAQAQSAPSSPFEQLHSDFQQQFGRPLEVTGGDTDEHIRIYGGPGRARDLRSRDLTPEQRQWVVNRGRELGLDAHDYSQPQHWTNAIWSGPHIHVNLPRQGNPTIKSENPTDNDLSAGIEHLIKPNDSDSQKAENNSAGIIAPSENLLSGIEHLVQPASASESPAGAPSPAQIKSAAQTPEDPTAPEAGAPASAQIGEPDFLDTANREGIKAAATAPFVGQPQLPELKGQPRSRTQIRANERILSAKQRQLEQQGEQLKKLHDAAPEGIVDPAQYNQAIGDYQSQAQQFEQDAAQHKADVALFNRNITQQQATAKKKFIDDQRAAIARGDEIVPSLKKGKALFRYADTMEGKPLYREIDARSNEQVDRFLRQYHPLLPQENIQDEAQLDQRLGELARMRGSLLDQPAEQVGPALEDVNTKILQLSQAKNDLLRMRAGGAASPQGPSSGQRPRMTDAERKALPWYQKGVMADLAYAVFSVPDMVERLGVGAERAAGATDRAERWAGHLNDYEQNVLGDLTERGTQGLPGDVSRAVLSTVAQLPALGGVARAGLGTAAGETAAFGLYGGIEAAGKPEVPNLREIGKSAVLSAAMVPIYKAAGLIPNRALRMAAAGAGGAAVPAIAGQQAGDIVSSAIISAAFAYPGGGRSLFDLDPNKPPKYVEPLLNDLADYLTKNMGRTPEEAASYVADAWASQVQRAKNEGLNPREIRRRAKEFMERYQTRKGRGEGEGPEATGPIINVAPEPEGPQGGAGGGAFEPTPERPALPKAAGETATWHAAGGDFPVTVLGEPQKGADGRDYVQIAESNTMIPKDDIEMPGAEAGQPEARATRGATRQGGSPTTEASPGAISESTTKGAESNAREEQIHTEGRPSGEAYSRVGGEAGHPVETGGVNRLRDREQGQAQFTEKPEEGLTSHKPVAEMSLDEARQAINGSERQIGTRYKAEARVAVAKGLPVHQDAIEKSGVKAPGYVREGDFYVPEHMATVSDVDIEAQRAATGEYSPDNEPTEAQKEAGNYQKAHVNVGGLNIAIENPEGTKRRPEWPALKSHYGYIKRSIGGDQENIDVFIRPGTDSSYSGPVFVVDQSNKDGGFDEHKVMLGWPTRNAAREGYAENYTPGWKVGPMRDYPSVGVFKQWLKTADTTKPATGVSNIPGAKTTVAPSSRVNLLNAPQGRPAPAGVKRLINERRQTEEKAAIDEHTGLQTKNQWLAAQPRVEADPSREIVALDVNDLKKANDTLGHDAGDQYLAHVGRVVREEAERLGVSNRQAFRTGGDEIVIDAPKGKGRELLAAVKNRVAEFEREGVRGSVAGGVGSNMKAADTLMYADKRVMKAEAANAEVRQKAKERVEAAKKETAKSEPAPKTKVAEKPASIESPKTATPKTAAEKTAEAITLRKAEKAAIRAKAQERVEAAKAENKIPQKEQAAPQPTIIKKPSELQPKTATLFEPANIISTSGTKATESETPTQKRKRIADDLKRQFAEMKEQGLADNPHGWNFAETDLKPIKEDESAIYQYRERRNYLATNQAGMRAFSKAYGRFVRGVAMTFTKAREVALRASELALEEKNPVFRKNLESLADALDEASSRSPEFAILVPGIKRRDTARHELTHVAQLALQRYFGKGLAFPEVEALPSYQAVKDGLVMKGYGYIGENPRALAHEGFAHIAGGQRGEIRLTLDQAVEFSEGYIKLIQRAYGSDALKRFDQLNGNLARFRNEVRRSAQEGTARTAQSGRGARSISGIPGAGARGPGEDHFEKRTGSEEGFDKSALEEIAFHGSPYRFEKFSKEKLLTGEGRNAYGAGLYFASRREVAEHYRSALSGDRFYVGPHSIDFSDYIVGTQVDRDGNEKEYYLGLKFEPMNGSSFISISNGYEWKEDRDDAIDFSKDDDGNRRDFDTSWKEITEALEEAHAIKPPVESGALYTVELAPQPDEYLLWDKPLSEQSEKVKAILESHNLLSGRAYFYKGFKGDANTITGERTYESIASARSPKAASDWLHSIGIRGIKYLDGSSRANGEGAYNYVIFDDKDITIQAMEDLAGIPLPEPIKAGLAEIARSFIEEGKTDFSELVAEFEELLGDELFDEVADYLPLIVEAEEKILRGEHERPVQNESAGPQGVQGSTARSLGISEEANRQRIHPSRQPGTKASIGAATSIVIPGTNREISAGYRVRELSDVYPSHNPQNFQPNPNYELVNDRRYDREKSYQQEIIANSKRETFKPQRLINNSDTVETGPPVIDQNGNVLGGNSRTMMLARVYESGSGTDYKAELFRQAAVYGLNIKDFVTMKRPILVREITDDQLSKQQAVTDLNITGTRALTPTERAASEAGKMPDATVDYLASKIEHAGDDATLAQVLDRSGVEIVNRLIDDTVFTPQERNALIKGGELLPEAKKRIERMMLGRLFRDLDQLERTPPSITRNMERIIAPLVKLSTYPDWDITEETRNAIDLITEAKAAGSNNLDEFARQPSMFRTHEYTPRELAIAHALQLGVVKTAKVFRQYTNEAANAQRGGGLFGSPTPGQAFDDAFGKATATQAGQEQPAAAVDYGTLERPNVSAIARKFAQDFKEGRAFGSIVEARKRASELLGSEVKPGTQIAKTIDEAVELGVVMEARRRVEMLNAGRFSPEHIYDSLVTLYEQQPTLGTKTSTSVRNQAYSTPAPIAFIASHLAGIDHNTTVYEPTAGNGMLLIEATPSKIFANELNQERAKNIASSMPGIALITSRDAAQWRPGEDTDVVIANPPFGPLKDDQGDSKVFEPAPGYRTTEIDHAIALKALEGMKDNGRAALIVGGINARDEQARSDGYNGKAKRAFYYTLYNAYNVVDHFTVAGDLYQKQGAGWPVDVIVIDGRGKSKRALPAVDVPRIFDSFDSLKGVLNEAPSANRMGAAGQPTATGARSHTGGDRSDTGLRPLSEPAGRQVREAADEGTELAEGARPGLRPTGERGARGEKAGSEERRAGTDLQQPAASRGAVAEGRAGQSAEGANEERPGSRETARTDQPESMAQPPAGSARQPRQVDLTQSQIPYQPHSAQEGAGTLVPVNMSTATNEALSRLEREVGNLDYFIAGELGYRPEEIGKYFNAEQVDALALAIRAMQTGAGFIIGDQTGIGKGRVVAGVIRYALKTGRTPIFVTEKPNLYKDIYRDLIDIGQADARPVMTNAGERIALTDDESVLLRSKDGAAHRRELQEMISNRSLGDHNIIFTTYSQMQTVKGARTVRMDFLDEFVRGGVLILDESHNAGGTEQKPQGKAAVNEMNRAKFTRGLVEKASGVFYSSATYAKRPQVMDLYSKTDMRLAVKAGGLQAAIEAGGVPLQQAVAAQLVESGQYIRRERSFEGVTYNTKDVTVDKRTAENISTVMRSIRSFDQSKQAAIEQIKQEAKAEAKAILGETATGAAGVHSTNFTSLMHNLVDQMLLGLKANAAVDEALAAARRGEKPVITVANTMGSFIEHYVTDNDLKPGDAIALNFGDMLRRYLERSRDVLVGNAFGAKERRRLTDEQLGVFGVLAYNQAKKLIESTDWSQIPVSPIDYIKSKLEQEGLKVGEITGRGHTVDYKNEMPIYRVRPGKEISIAGRNRTITRFNSGDTDVMILNQAGATGLSLHASAKFRDQRKRHMIIAQAEKNIDTHMQMLGRVHRTGQVVLPEYTQLAADIPAEKRPAAILAKKMASLNANTTAARGSAVTAKNVTDFMNDYGDEIAASLMNDNPDLHAKLGSPLKHSETGEGLEVEGAIRKVTGRIPLLSLKEQEELYNLIESEYNDLIAQLDALGENALEAKMVDLDAKPIKATVVFAGAGDRPFTRSARAEVMDVKLVGKPYTSDEVLKILNEHFGTEEKTLAELRHLSDVEVSKRDVDARFREYKREVLDEIEDPQRQQAKRTVLDAQARRLDETLETLPVGQTVEMRTGDATFYGIVTKVEQKGNPKNPVALGSWKFTFAVADSMRRLTLPASKINGEGQNQVKVEQAEATSGLFKMPILDFFDKSQQQSREKRTIITGNMLAGFGRFKAGKIVNFSDHAGNIRQGILMPRDWSIEKALDAEPIDFATADQMLKFLDETNGLVQSNDKAFNLGKRGSEYRFFTPASKAAGGRYFLNQPLITAASSDFVKSGDMMQVIVSRSTAMRVIGEAQRQGVVFQANAFKDAARKITGKPAPTPSGESEPEAFEDLVPVEPVKRKQRPPVTAARRPAPTFLTGSLTKGVAEGWDKFLNLAVRNLSHLKRVSPTAHTAALRAGGARGQATVLLTLATAKITNALEGSGIDWSDTRAALVESRLRGIAKRYQGYADRISETDDEGLSDALAGGTLNVLQNIEGRAGLDDTLAQRAVAMLESDRFDDLRDFLIDAFEAAAERVGTALEPEDYDRITGNSKFRPALRLYKELIERPIAESHSLNEGIFSDALGPLDTYYPLVAVKDDGGILHKIFGVAKYPYRKPKNIANYFATGLAEHGYSTGMEDFADRIRGAIRTNNKANLLSELDRQGLIRVLGPKEKAPEEAYLGGSVTPVNTVETRADLVIVRDGKSQRVPAARAIIPTWLEKELKPILAKERLEPGMGQSLINKVIEASLVGPFDLVFHATNVLGSLVANTPFVGKSIIGKTVGNLPMTKWLTAIMRTIQTDPTSEQSLKDMTEMANIGLIPPRYGSVASGWLRAGRKFAAETGAKKSFTAAPLLYGPKGLDVRARLVMYRVAKEINPKASPQQLFDFVTQLGVYNRELESQIERWAKSTRLFPFATAGFSMLRNGLNAWVGPIGTQPIPIGGGGAGGSGSGGGGNGGGVGESGSEGEGGGAGKRFGYRIATYLSGGAAGLVLMWALAYREYKKKWPWQDPEARLLQIPLNEADRNSKYGQILYGKDPTKTAYVNFAFFSPLVSRGARTLGLTGAFETHQLGGTGGQSFEYAQRDVLNSLAHPFVSGPLVRAPFVFITGKEPQLTSLRDTTGQFGPQFYPATVKAAPGLPMLGRRAEEALLNINPFFQAGAAMAGVGHQGEDKPGDQKAARWVKMITDIAAPRLLGSAVDTLKKQQQLERERKASESEPATEAKLPDDVRVSLHKAGVIPNKPPRKPGESNEDYLKRSEAAQDDITQRVRAIADTEAFKGMDKAAQAETLKHIIKDSRHDEALASKRNETAKEGELLTARSIAEDEARAKMIESEAFKALNGDQQKKAQSLLTRYFTENFELSSDERKLADAVRSARAERRMNILTGFVRGGRVDKDVQRILIEARRKAA